MIDDEQAEVNIETSNTAHGEEVESQDSSDTGQEFAMEEAQYREIIDKYKTALEEEWDGQRMYKEGICTFFDNYPNCGYVFLDIDNNGIKELVVGAGNSDEQEGVIYDLYTIIDGEITQVLSSVTREYYRLCSDYKIACIGHGGFLSIHSFYTLEEDGASLKLYESVIEDFYEEGWYYSTTEGNYNESEISEDEANRRLDSYEYMSIIYTPFTE